MFLGYMVESVARDLLRESILVPVGAAWCNSRLIYVVSIMSDARTFCTTSLSVLRARLDTQDIIPDRMCGARDGASGRFLRDAN